MERKSSHTSYTQDNLVYLDWAATAPLCQEAADAMAPYMVPGIANLAAGGNANSLHSPGRSAFAVLEDARARIACALHAARPDEIIFTSGATEADNTALFGSVRAAIQNARQTGKHDFVPAIIISAIEHDAVLSAADELEREGCRVIRLAPTSDGFICVEALEDACADLEQEGVATLVLVSVMLANNEIGSIQPVADLAACAHAHGALFHTDATQALGKVPISLRDSGWDLASLSAHKVCGPKGIGALYLKSRVVCSPFMLGGGQERGRRSGTQNVCGAVGFAAALECAVNMQEAETARLTDLRDTIYERASRFGAVTPTVEVAKGSHEYLPNIANLIVSGVESETMILRLDNSGVCVSGGSACSSHSLDPSHVLSAIGVSRDKALCSLRISMGRYTKAEDIDAFFKAFERDILSLA